MPSTVPHTSTEVAAEVESMEALINEHRTLSRQVAELYGKYGPYGVADDIRKAELMRLREEARDQAMKAGEKVTEAALDAKAYAHPDYHELLGVMEMERERFFLAQNEITYIEWRVNRAYAVLRQRSIEGLR